jgi:hypothetical protein
MDTAGRNMHTNKSKPAFITFTGVDEAALLPGMQLLAKRFPIEWGVLIDPDKEARPLFPGPSERRLIQASALRLSAHVCGSAAMSIVAGHDPGLELQGYSRVQINHSREGSSELAILNGHAFGTRHSVRVALQCQGGFPADARVDWLYDVSFGTGKAPAVWPAITSARPLCGYSGGIGPSNVAALLTQFPVTKGVPFWIDMESGVRTAGRFDLQKCAAVCEQVFGRGA